MTTLFDSAPVARHSDPETSHQAAESVSAERVRISQQQVLDILRKHGAMTDETLCRHTVGSQSASGTRTRRAELVRKGLVEFAGRYGETMSGRKTRIWQLLSFGDAMLISKQQDPLNSEVSE